MNIDDYSELLKQRNKTPEEQQFALAVFAYEYIEQTDKQIKDYSKFKTNGFEDFMN